MNTRSANDLILHFPEADSGIYTIDLAMWLPYETFVSAELANCPNTIGLSIIEFNLEHNTLSFSIDDKASIFESAQIILEDNHLQEFSLAVINGVVQSIANTPVYDPTKLDSDDLISFEIELKDVWPYQASGDIVLYASTHNTISSELGASSYKVYFNGHGIEETLDGTDHIDSALWQLQYYYDSYDLQQTDGGYQVVYDNADPTHITSTTLSVAMEVDNKGHCECHF